MRKSGGRWVGIWRPEQLPRGCLAGLTQTGHTIVVRGRGAGRGRAFGVGLDEVDSLAVRALSASEKLCRGFSLLGGCQPWRPSPSLCETARIRLGPLINYLVLGAKMKSCALQVWRCVLAFPSQVPFKQAKLTRSSRLVLNPCQFARQ